MADRGTGWPYRGQGEGPVDPPRGALSRLRRAAKRIRGARALKPQCSVTSVLNQYGETWDYYRVEFAGHELDISAEVIEGCFQPLREEFKEDYGRQKTILKVRVVMLDDKKKAATETWVTVSATTAFGIAFEQIDFNVESWLTKSSYVSFDAIELETERRE